MKIIGENIHIVSPRVKEALAEKNLKFFQELAVSQVEGGAGRGIRRCNRGSTSIDRPCHWGIRDSS